MSNLTSHEIVAAAFSYSEKGRNLSLPDYNPGEAIQTTPFRAALGTGDYGLRAPVRASEPATAESKATEKVLESALSAFSPGLGKGYKLGQSSLTLATTFNDPDSSLRVKAKASADFVGNLLGFAKVPFPRLGANPLFLGLGHVATATALVCDLCGAVTEKPERLSWARSAP